MVDEHKGFKEGLQSPADEWFPVTPGPTELPFTPRAIYVGTAGDIIMEDKNGDSATFKALSGQLIPVRPRKILAGTTAEDIVAIY